MNERFWIAIVILIVLLVPQFLCAQESVIADGARVEKLAGNFRFTEGPAVDVEGNVYFTDQPNDRIMKWSVDGHLSTFKQPSGRSNGLYFDRDGRLLACADQDNQLWSIDQGGEVTILVRDYEGKLLNGPNDLWVHPRGGIYFTDPFYKRPYWDRDSQELEKRSVYFLSPDRRTLSSVEDSLIQPNGIVGTPDGRRLYVSDIGDGKTYVYDIQVDGQLGNRHLFCELGSDGMTLDEQGNLYLTGKGVIVFDKQGKKIEHIAVEERWTANVCFGGKDRRTLFITASESLYALRMSVKGVD